MCREPVRQVYGHSHLELNTIVDKLPFRSSNLWLSSSFAFLDFLIFAH